MRILLTGHKGYIGAVAGPILRSAGHEVVGLDTDLFAGCEFGEAAEEIPEVRKDIRDLDKRISMASTQSCIWPRCRMILWGT